jgi:hypothetical protein
MRPSTWGVLHHHRLVKRRRDGIYVRYEVVDPMVFTLCNLAYGKAARDVRFAAGLFNRED